EQVTGGDPSGHEETVVPGHQVVGGEYLIEVVAAGQRLLALGLVPRPQLGLNRSAHALQRARRGDAFRGAADAHQHVDLAALAGGTDRAGDVAVGDEPDPGARVAYLTDQLLVAGAVQDADRDVVDLGLLDRRDA